MQTEREKADTSLSSLEQENRNLQQVTPSPKDCMPPEYITGRATFMGLSFHCSPDTLIPREETELLVEVALDMIREGRGCGYGLTVLDMGTGCGNIAVSLALLSRAARVLASDISPAAVEIARKNVEHFGVQDRVVLFCGDLFSPFHGVEYEGRVDVIVCNPPYLPTGSLRKLAPEIINHQPIIALDAGAYGISLYRRLVADSLSVLRPGGRLVFEIGAGQDNLVSRLLKRSNGYGDIRYFRDSAETIRVMSAVKQLGSRSSEENSACSQEKKSS